MQPSFDTNSSRGTRKPLNSLEVKQGVKYYPSYFDENKQQELTAIINDILTKSPLFTPRMPKTNTPFSVKMCNCGELGWVSDIKGYRYQANHPENGEPWQPMPQILLDLWNEVSVFSKPPEACLINLYEPSAKMGLHQDRDELNFEAPVVSVSLGLSALFRIGGLARSDKTQSIKLHQGDVITFGGASRLIFHGIDRIYEGIEERRINLTLRRVSP